ncbi:DUF3738 domain-containing protein [Algoriphagus halophytocola]|uniref:redoxin domain-containing protein n=1 Tax=Algoriphagus halophytocola TaxID=2991499 RepID=UPI0022DDD0D5|nr:redoxin domain-containing protein [Algoriphagus sp. TR-M9]WBL43558.1 DUF3738 domain-containing protein [Algoriphagus sp. TR-M9]
MKKLILICLLGLLCLPTSTSTAQVADSPGADLPHRSTPQFSSGMGETHRGGDSRSDTLSIGDQIPAGIEFSEVLHYDSDKLRLDDYRGKYVILEFWAPTCTASIASLPQLDAIQKKYGDRIAILPITVFAEDQITQTISGNKRLEAVALPLVVDARKMRSYFPHSVIPHVVVLDPEGKVVGITGIEDITTANLDELLSTGESSFRTKEDMRVRLPKGERLVSGSPEVGNKNIWFQSAMTGYIPEIRGGLYQNFEEMSHIRITNRPLYDHYSLAYSGKSMEDYFGRNRFETEGFGEEELTTSKSGNDYREWMAQGNHVFGYELIAPAHTDPYELMREDLRRFFPHIEAKVEKKKKTVYALIQQEGSVYPASTTEKSSYAMDAGLQMRNLSIQGLVHHLNVVFLRNSPYPVINKTGLDYPIDLDLQANFSDVESLGQALREKGLDLVKREEEINVLVIRKVAEPKLLAL